MKKCAVIACVLLVLSVLSGCLKDEVGGVRLTAESDVEVYSVAQQRAMFLFYTGGPWTATTDASWLKVAKERGPGGTDTLLIITTEKNLTGAARMAHVTVESGSERKTIDVRQSEEYAIFDRKDFVMPAEGGLLDVTFRTNVPDSLQLYVTGYMVSYLEDTRKTDSVSKTRATEVQGSLEWLRVLPNESDTARTALFFLSISNPQGGRIDLDTLRFGQLPADFRVDTTTVATRRRSH